VKDFLRLVDGERGTAVWMPADDDRGAVCIMIGDK